MIRPERDEVFMAVAHVFASRATCPRAQVGAVLVKDTHIIAHGYNGSPPGLPHCDEAGCTALPDDEGCGRAVHAEANSVAYAARMGVTCQGAVLYCTHEPCLRCAQLILSAGIRRVVYAEAYRDHSGRMLLKHAQVQVEWQPNGHLPTLITDG